MPVDSRDQLAPREQPAQSHGREVADAARFESILFEGMAQSVSVAAGEPMCFGDLNLDQVLESIVAACPGYELASVFYAPLHDAAAVGYRHEILRDLEREDVARAVRGFGERMVEMRKRLALVTKLRHVHQKERWFLSAVEVYCGAVKSFVNELRDAPLHSSGLLRFRTYLCAYSSSPAFVDLDVQAAQLRGDLAEVSYAIALKGMRVTVSRYEDAPDLTSEIEETFAKFREGAVKDYHVRFPNRVEVNHVEGQILDFVADLHRRCSGACATMSPLIGISWMRRSRALTARFASTSPTSNTSNRSKLAVSRSAIPRSQAPTGRSTFERRLTCHSPGSWSLPASRSCATTLS